MKKQLLILALCIAPSVFAQIPATLSASDKVYGLARFWQEVNYNFVYLHQIDRAYWDAQFKAFIESVQATPNDYAYYRELERFCALLKDGHTNVYPPASIKTMTTMFGSYRLFVEHIDGKAIITRTNASKREEIPIGTEIIEVNGQTTAAYIRDHVAPYISTSAPHVLPDLSMNRLLKGLEGDHFRLRLRKPSGEETSLSLTHQRTTEEAVYPPFDSIAPLLEFKWLPDSIAYVSLNSFEDAKIVGLFTKQLPLLYRAKGLVVDLRNNGGGSSSIAASILKFMTRDSFLLGSRTSTRQHVPVYKAWGAFLKPVDTSRFHMSMGFPKAEARKYFWMAKDSFYIDLPYDSFPARTKLDRVVIPTALLIGHSTASAAEDFLIYADRQKHMVRIGEPTFGSTGQPYMFDLPGGGSARVCTKRDTYPDGRVFVGVGVKPDIEVKRTVADFLAKRDPVLDRAMQELKMRIQ